MTWEHSGSLSRTPARKKQVVVSVSPFFETAPEGGVNMGFGNQ